jgi:penicillin-binding protein 1A
MISVRQALYFSTIIFLCFSALIAGAFFYIIHYKVIDFSVLEHYDPGKPSIVLDDQGKEWTRFQLDRREPVSFDTIPSHLINAFIAAEDWNFFKHSGISWKGIARSIFVNLYYGCKMQGASTITQQLVKLLFLHSEKTFSRKLQEQVYAFLVEQQFSKEQILHIYLNHIYFGCGIYGVQAASQRFWDKDVQKLTIDEAATLASIVCCPAYYCPLTHPLSAQKRRNTVLSKMKMLGYITDEQYQEASKKTLLLKEQLTNPCAPHLREYIRQTVEQMFGKQQVYSGGLTIKTTLNRELQTKAEQYFNHQINQLRSTLLPDIDGGLISIEVKTGHIKALIGGYDFATSKFNRALQACRQIGSTFKPLLYAAALQQGKHFYDTEIDEPISIEQAGKVWSPHNFNHRFVGQATLAYALSHSNNIISVKTLLDIGAAPVIALAYKAHLNGPLHPYPSLALGCVDATLKEVVGMFNIFANNGVYVELQLITWIKDRWGNKIFKSRVIQEPVMHAHIAGQVANVMKLSIERYKKLSGFHNRWLPCEAICKTGTTNDSRTCWFTGSTPKLTTAVYIGCDDNRSMGHNIYPLATAFPIWFSLHKTLSCTEKTFSYDPSLQEIIIDELTGLQLNDDCGEGAIKILI